MDQQSADDDWGGPPPRNRPAADGAAPEVGGRTAFRRAFWLHYSKRVPRAHLDKPGNASSRWRHHPRVDLVVALYVGDRGVGVFVRGRRGVPMRAAAARLAPFAATLETALGVRLGSPNAPFHARLAVDARNPGEWDRMADWLDAEARRYSGALHGVRGLEA